MTLAARLGQIQQRIRDQDLATAITEARAAAAAFPQEPAIHALLGSTLRRAGQPAEGARALERALALNTRIPNAWLELARCRLALGQARSAVDAVNQGLALAPDSAVAVALMFEAAEAAGDRDAADRWFAAHARADARRIDLRLALGNEAFDRGEGLRASWHFRSVAALAPKRAEAHLNLAAAHMLANDAEAAAAAIASGLGFLPADPRLHQRRCELDELRGRPAEERIAHARAWLAIAPGSADARLLLAYARLAAADFEGARADLDVLLDAARSPWPAFWVRQHYPRQPVFPDETAMAQYRAEVRSLVGRLDTDLAARAIDPSLAARMLAACPNYHLAYLNDVDQSLPRAYGDTLRRLALASGLTDAAGSPRKQHERLRVLVFTAHTHQHSVSRVWRDLLLGLPRDEFELVVANPAVRDDDSTARWKSRADTWLDGAKPIAAWRDALVAMAPDVIVYPDIGMEPVSQALASLRLAPVQVATWGHPASSGLPTIDWFLSSDLAEPGDAPAHYNETLVRLPGLATSYRFFDPGPRPPAPPRQHAVRLLCLQNAFKLMPVQDAAFRAILEAVPDAELWFVANTRGPALAAFEQRLRRNLGAALADRVTVRPALAYPEYCALLESADLVLDSWGWSGGLTSLDALCLGVPVLTWPGALMRGRQTLAMLRAIGIPELVADDGDDYCRRAIAFARDPAARAALKPRLDAARTLIEDDAPARAAVIDFFRSLRTP